MSKLPRVAVIGGGIGGLAAARALLRSGDCDVTLFEASDRVGGVIRSEEYEGYLHEHAANGFLDNVPDGAVPLAEELGVPVVEASPAAKKRWIFADGVLKQVPMNPLQAVRTNLISLRGKLFALGEPFRKPHPNGDESVASFARRRLGDEVVRVAVGPFVTGIYAGDPEQLSLKAAFPKLAALEERGGLVRGMIAKMRESRSNGTPRRSNKLCAPIGGVGRLVDAIAAEVGDAIRTGATVERIEQLKNGRLRLRGNKLGKTAAQPYDAVVLAVNAPLAAKLVEHVAPEASAPLEQIEYARVAVAYLGFRADAVPHPLDGFGFLVAQGEPVHLLGCVFESTIWPDRAPAGHVLLRCVLGGVRDPGIVELDDEAVVGAAMADLDKAIGLQAKPEHQVVHRHSRAIAQYNIGHLERVAAAERACDSKRIVLAGASYHGVAVNSCVGDAARVARKVLQHVAMLALLLMAFAACSGGGSGTGGKPTAPTARGDAGDAGQAAAPAPEPAPAAGRATVEIKAVWPKPAAELLRAPGRNACGEVRRAPIPVAPDAVIADRYATERMVGLAGAVVTLEGVPGDAAAAPAEPSELALRGCVFEPRVARVAEVGAPLALINDDERRHEVSLEYLGDRPQPVATVPLPVIGRRVEVPLPRPGIVRAVSASDPEDVAYAVVPEHGYVRVADASGTARFDDVPAGSYTVTVWYPPLKAGGEPRVGAGSVDVDGDHTATARVAVRTDGQDPPR